MNTSDEEKPAPESTFHCFPRLPIELRIKIWRDCLPGSRIIDIASFCIQEVVRISADTESIIADPSRLFATFGSLQLQMPGGGADTRVARIHERTVPNLWECVYASAAPYTVLMGVNSEARSVARCGCVEIIGGRLIWDDYEEMQRLDRAGYEDDYEVDDYEEDDYDSIVPQGEELQLLNEKLRLRDERLEELSALRDGRTQKTIFDWAMTTLGSVNNARWPPLSTSHPVCHLNSYVEYRPPTIFNLERDVLFLTHPRPLPGLDDNVGLYSLGDLTPLVRWLSPSVISKIKYLAITIDIWSISVWQERERAKISLLDFKNLRELYICTYGDQFRGIQNIGREFDQTHPVHQFRVNVWSVQNWEEMWRDEGREPPLWEVCNGKEGLMEKMTRNQTRESVQGEKEYWLH